MSIMQSILFTVAVVASYSMAARLDNTYLPARGTSGSGAGFVSAPFGGGSGGGGGGRFPSGGSGGGAGRYSGGGAPSGPVIPIVSYENHPNQGDGVYSYSYETGNGISAQESGHPSSASGPEGPGTAAQGSFSYKGPDGQTYTVTYTADENGFQAQGAHLPTPPPIPPEILKSLQLQGSGGFGAGGSGPGTYSAPSSSFGGAGSGFQSRPTQSFSPATGYQYRK